MGVFGMIIINPDVQILTPIDETDILKRIEEYGRVCYKSENRITEDSAAAFVYHLIHSGHESVLEHCSFTVKFIVDRGISHEIVRHRIASYSQESTRYCNYSTGKFGREITVIRPNQLEGMGDEVLKLWKESCQVAEWTYMRLLDKGVSPQDARTVLPMSLKTEIIMTANIREWRHFLFQRCSPAAHPQMREVAFKLLNKCCATMPVLFEDIRRKIGA